MPRAPITLLLFLCVSVLLAGCSSFTKAPNGRPLMKDGRYASSYNAFVADPNYRHTRDVWYHDARISQAGTKNSKIVIHLKNQRGVLWVDDQVAMDFPVCTGRSTHETPRGRFTIIQKDEDYRSRSYGSVFDVSGKCVNSDATSSSPVPRAASSSEPKCRCGCAFTEESGCMWGPCTGMPIPTDAFGCLWRHAAFCLTNAAWERP